MRKLAFFSAAFALAAAAYVYGLTDAWWTVLTAVSIAVSAAARFLHLRRISIVCLGLAAALLWCSGYEQLFLRSAFALDETEQTAAFRVAEQPYATSYGAAAKGKAFGYEAVLYADESLLRASVGDTVHCRAKVSLEKDDLQRRADGTVLELSGKGVLKVVPGYPTFPQQLRLWLQGRIDRLYSEETAGLVKALLTGDRYDLSYETVNALSVSGMSHAVAVSGMHVSVLLAAVSMLCGYRRKLLAAIWIPTVIVFALMTGASPSVCRASVMQIMLLVAPLVRRERDSITTLAAAAFVLLLQNPWCIASISFQLSFAAVAGLMVFSSPMQKKILSVKKNPGRLLRGVSAGVSATLSATLCTLPLTVYYFGLVSIAAPITNLLALWAVTAVFVLGFSSMLLGQAVSWAVVLLSKYILTVVDLIASAPFSAAYPYHVPLMVWAVLFYFFFAAVLLFPKVPIRWGLCFLTAGFLVCILGANMQFFTKSWKMTALDVGQGQCLVLRMGGYITLVDCGGSDPQAAGENAARFLHSTGVTHIDSLILTHYDDDHAGGASQFLSRIEVDTVYLPPGEKAEETAKALKTKADHVHRVESQTEISFPGGTLTLLPSEFAEFDSNAGVCVLATAGEYDILIPGDMTAAAEIQMLSRWQLPKVELLVVGHHGASDSTSQTLLEQVRPETAVISVGKDNRYGHPHIATLLRLEQFGAQIYRTDRSGTLHFYPQRR